LKRSMNGAKRHILILAVVLLCSSGCGPDAKRDNPLDPVNGRGVYGTVRNSVAAVVPGAVVTARPANVNATCDAQGAYQLELPAGERYLLTVSHPLYWDTTDTVTVPSDGKLEHDFIVKGKPSLSQPKVNTYKIAHENGDFDYGLRLECLGTHPEGQVYLNAYDIYAAVNSTNYPADPPGEVDSFSKKYTWDLDLAVIFGAIPDPESLIIGKPVSFNIDPGQGLVSLQATVPVFNPVPTNLNPGSGSVISLPGSLSWTNASASLTDITVEVWQGTEKKWSFTTSNVSMVQCTAALEPGAYVWLVRTTDINGNEAAAEATFTIN